MPGKVAMLGPPKPRRLNEPIAVSLEEVVPTEHFYRHLEATLDLDFVREWGRGLYASGDEAWRTSTSRGYSSRRGRT